MNGETASGSKGIVVPQFRDGQAHVWLIDLSPADFIATEALVPREGSRAEAILAPEEFARARRFVKEDLRIHFTAAHVALRGILAAYLRRSPAEVPLTTEDLGRPILDPLQISDRLHFNLSHSHAFAVLAVALTGPIGIDLEEVRSMESRDGVARQVHSPEQCQRLQDASDEQWFDYWTAKEAVLKALGKGFHLDPRRVSLDDALTKAIAHDHDGDVALYLNRFDLPQQWSGCVATQWRCEDLIVQHFDWNRMTEELR